MQSIQQLKALPDDELLRHLAALLEGSRHTEADLVAHIGEVDARRLYAREASPSMFVYCLERLHLSEAEAYLRIAAARASREHPMILAMLVDGRLHLTGIALLAPHLTRENRDVLLQRATHKTKREIEELVAGLSPRPDAPALIRKLPERGTVSSRPGALPPSAVAPVALPSPVPLQEESGPADQRALELRPDVVVSGRLDGEVSPEPEATADEDTPASLQSTGETAMVFDHRSIGGRMSRTVAIEPLSPARYKVQFTASAELRDKLERLRDLMRSSVPDGDLAAIIDAAVSEKLERLEAQRYGKAKSPRTTLSGVDTSPRRRELPAAVRRAVHEREGGRCRYVDDQGRRCTGRAALEFHHRRPFALGGDHSPTNVSLLCKAHNTYLAQIDFGRKAVGERRRTSAEITSTPDVNLPP